MSTTAPPRPGRTSTGSAPFARSIKVPQPRTPFIDPTTGGPSREWLYYLQALWDRTGQASGVAAYLPIGGGTLTGPLTLAGDPVSPNEAATKDYVDDNAGGGGIPDAPSNSLTYGRFNATWAQVLSLQYGGIVQGPIQLLTQPIVPNDVATKAYVDAAIAGGGDWVDAPSDGNAWGRRNATWIQVLPLAGGTLTGSLTVPSLLVAGNAQPTGFFAASGNLFVMVDNVVPWQFTSSGATANLPLTMSGAAITALANPVNAQDAATKAYVDAQAGGISDAPSDGSAYGRLNAAWSQVLPLSGGIVTGEVLSAITPASSDALITKRYVDAALADVSITYLPLIGGTLTGPLNLPNGTVAIPALQLGADDGTGLSRSANAIVMGVQGATVFATFFNAAQLFQPLYMLNNRIQQLGDPTAATDALNLRTADARYLTSAALAPYAPLASPALTGIPTAPTPAGTDSSTTIATTAFVAGTYAPRVSPTLTGNPTSPTATAGTNTNQIATTAFVQSAVVAGGIADAPSDGTAYGRLNAAWSRVLPLSGGTLTGALTLAGDGATALAPVTVQQINNVVGQLLPLSGGTMTGPITLAANQIIDGRHP